MASRSSKTAVKAASGSDRHGLRWTNTDSRDLTPSWSIEPPVTAITSISQRFLALTNLCVTAVSSSASRKVYTISCPSDPLRQYLFNALLPLEPRLKTASEVATISYISRRTSVPVPAVVAYDCSVDNELGFEWILMQKRPGKSYEELQQEMDLQQKQEVVEKLAEYTKEVRVECPLDAIGSLYFRRDPDERELERCVETEEEDIVIGPAVTRALYWGPLKRFLTRDLGPWKNEQEFVGAYLQVLLKEQQLQHLLVTGDHHFTFRNGEELTLTQRQKEGCSAPLQCYASRRYRTPLHRRQCAPQN
jgi:hypothetical protein